MTPGLTCAACERPFGGLYARRTDAGWIHADDCPPAKHPRRCNCRPCRDGRTAAQRDRRAAARAEAAADPDDPDPMAAGGDWVTVRGIARWVPTSVVG